MIVLALGCMPMTPPAIEVAREGSTIDVSADRPMQAIAVLDRSGAPVMRRALPAPLERASLPIAPPPGATWRVIAAFPGGELAESELQGPLLPVDLAIEAPKGQGRRPLSPGDRLSVLSAPGAEASLVITALSPQEVSVDDGTSLRAISLGARGDRAVLALPLDRDRDVRVMASDQGLSFSLRPVPLDPEAARKRLVITDVSLPADAEGKPDPTRPSGRLTAPTGLLAWLRLGPPEAPDLVPFARVGISLRNEDKELPVDLLLRARFLDEDFAPAPAFRSRLRGEEDLPYVSVLLRVPPGEQATAALPIWLDPSELPAGRARFLYEIDVIPLGASEPLHTARGELLVERGFGAAGGGLLAALAVSIAGWSAIALRGRSFLAGTSIVDLSTIAMFSSATFAVGAALQLVGMAFGALLGPLAPFVMGLPDDVMRAVLLSTLLTLLPKPGVFATSAVVGALMRAILLGGIHPVDLIYVGTVIATHEAALWASGVTRETRWREAPAAVRWLRLTLGLAIPNAAAVGLGLASTAVLYRLWYAPWYAAALVLLPGLLYVSLGVYLALPIAAGLRSVAR